MTPLILYVAYIRMETENAWIIISWVSWYHWTRDVTGPLHPAAGAGWALSLNSGNLSSSSARRRTHATTATASPVLEDKTQLWEWCGGAVVRWCGGAAAPSSSTAPQQDVCCGAVRGMALTPTLAVAPGLCSALAPLWPGPTSGHCGQCRAGIKWNEAHYVGLTRGSVQCLLVLSCCGGGMCRAARCWLEHWSRPTPFLRRTGWRGVHWSGAAAGTGTCGDGPAQNTWVWHPPLHRPCSALSTHSAEYPHWSRWLGSSAAELAALAQWMARDTQHRYAGLAGLGWAGLTMEIYKYFVQLPWVWPLAGGCWAEQETNRFGDIYPGSGPAPLATTGHHWHMSPHSPGLLHLSPHCFPQSETRTGSSSGRQESGVIAMYGLAVLLFMLAVTTWQWNMIMFCEFDCLMKPDNIHSSVCFFVCFSKVIWNPLILLQVRLELSRLWCRVLSSYFHPAVALAPAPPSRQGDGESGGKFDGLTQLRATNLTAIADPTFAINGHRSPAWLEIAACVSQNTNECWELLVWSPRQPSVPCCLLGPWHLGTMVPGAQHSADQIYCFVLTERSRYRHRHRQPRQSGTNYSLWSEHGEERGGEGGGGPHWFLGTGSCYLSTVNCLKVILLLFRSQISRFVWFAALLVCIALLHWWMQWYDEDNDDRRTTDTRQPQ